ncbi:hypothetical protein 7865G3D9_28 [Haloquadratum phage sp.]|nr:hypothetical protein 7865G3D9_28 [Haloquadratum phage sp.]
MTVRIQSGTTVFVNSGQTVQTPQVQNAGTITNAGTTQQFRSNVASGSGSGLGAARTSPVPFPRASGIGESFGNAVESPIRNISAGDLFFPKRLQVNTNDTQDIRNDKIISLVEVQNAGTVRNEGTTQVSQTPSPPKEGIGEMFGQATTSRLTDRQASGFSEGLGTARTSPIPFPRASGRGSGLGTAQAQEKRLKTASGFGASSGKSIPLTLFDPIGHMATILSNITKSEVRLPKPERIAPIWEYSHNDRVNFPDPAVYFYAPTESPINKFSIDGDTTNQTNTVEILVMTLSEVKTRSYQQQFIRYLAQFYDDNQTETGFHRFQNITASDIRNEHITQQTDHYIASITFEVQRFTDI